MSKSLFSGFWSQKSIRREESPSPPPTILRKNKMPANAERPMYDYDEDNDVEDHVFVNDAATGTPPRVPPKVSFTGVGDSPSTTRSDSERDHDELIAKIRRLELDLSQARIDLTAERALRKKKERNLVKLAKELKKRQAKDVERDQETAELRSNAGALSAKLAATHLELDQRVQTKEEVIRHHEDELHEIERKYRNVCREQDVHVTELIRKHSVEVDDLRRQLNMSSQDSDRLRSKLVSLEVKEAERIAETAMSGNFAGYEYEPRRNFRWKHYVLAGLVIVFAALYQITGLSMDAICSPVMAGTRLHGEGIWEAPWWAPAQFKENAFQLCGSRPRTALSWSFAAGGTNRISVKTAGDQARILLDRRVASAIVKDDRIDLGLEKKDRVESIKLPWAT